MGGDSAARPPEPPERVIALALAAGHVDLYVNSPSFHDAVDTLAALLPAMVDGLAAQANAQDAQRETLRERVARAGTVPRIVPLDERRPR